MKQFNLSLNPTYHCNFRCHFCYLTKEQLSDHKRLNLDELYKRLIELKAQGISLTHVDLYGGEIALLPQAYLDEIEKVLYQFGQPKINVITNLSYINTYFLKDHIDLTVSFDFEAREKHELVMQNIFKLAKPVSMLMLASDKLLQMNVDEMIAMLNRIGNLRSVEIKPYSQNQSNQLDVRYSAYEDFVKKWITSDVRKKFIFVNQDLILDVLDGNRNAYSDNHIYITPDGHFAVLEFDKNDREYFLELKSIQEYFNWANTEKLKVRQNAICSKCSYVERCLTEHYRDVKDINHSCNGFRDLLHWSENYFSQDRLEHNNSKLL
jgi:sulfatase maturation enzyme AslB (radical SAM superfamily)